MEIPDKKLLKYALQYIRGIGRVRAGLIISELNMTNKLAEDLTRREVAAIGEEISKYLVGRELATVVEGDIKIMKDIQCYKGIRHIDKLPGRGQRTSTNSRTKIALARGVQLHHQTVVTVKEVSSVWNQNALLFTTSDF